jgi:hypothetical protein
MSDEPVIYVAEDLPLPDEDDGDQALGAEPVAPEVDNGI